MTYYKEQEQWLDTAENCRPPLVDSERRPTEVVRPVKDPAGFQGWAMERLGPPDLALGVLQKRKAGFVLDFGEHVVGYLRLTIGLGEKAADAPLRLRLVFGEVPAEIGEAFDPFQGTLSRSWLQDEIINIDALPGTVDLPRRYAFRYLKIEIIDSSPAFRVKFDDIVCRAVSSADHDQVNPKNEQIPLEWQDLDRVSLRTTANCMQTVFEDGPKRDRRLWMGDLRLQALTNYETFRNYQLVKRCLYLFAGLADAEGKVSADLYEHPVARRGGCYILENAAFFPVVLHDYCKASGDHRTAIDLWPVALRQLDVVTCYVDNSGLFIDPGNVWIFLDWCEPLHRQAAMHAVLIYAIRRIVALAEDIGEEKSVTNLVDLVGKMRKAARENFWDPSRKLWVSGKTGQVSYASWAWMTLARTGDGDEAKQSYDELAGHEHAIQPVTPYMYHNLVDAMFVCGLKNEAKRILKEYWGGMIAKGATTFWEVYRPGNDYLSPYKNHLLNSYCHAFSSTPAYFIRKYLLI